MPTLSGPITADGAVITISLGVSEARRRTMQRVNLPVPLRSVLRVVVDPGSAMTLADEVRGIGPLRVRPRRQQGVVSSASGLTVNLHSMYELSVELLDDGGHPLMYWPRVGVLGTTYDPAAVVQGVFGRDLLADCVFHYDGKGGRFSLTV
jgi:hypothetical protein